MVLHSLVGLIFPREGKGGGGDFARVWVFSPQIEKMGEKVRLR